MNSRRDWLWVDESQIIKHKVTHRYFREGEYEHDPLRFAYLIKPNSRTHVLLALKGVRIGPKKSKMIEERDGRL